MVVVLIVFCLRSSETQAARPGRSASSGLTSPIARPIVEDLTS
jgi:hypothetical protein